MTPTPVRKASEPSPRCREADALGSKGRRASGLFGGLSVGAVLCALSACSSPSTANGQGQGGTPGGTAGGTTSSVAGGSTARAGSGAVPAGGAASGASSAGAPNAGVGTQGSGGASLAAGGGGGAATNNGGASAGNPSTGTAGLTGGATSGGATTGGATNRGGAGGTSGGLTSAGGATAGGASTGGSAGTGGTQSSGCSSTAAGFYIDSTAGNDANDGQTPATAWKTLTKVNSTTLQPGGRLCFRAGGSWTGQLKPLGSGSSTAPIVIDQFGTGAKPQIAAGSSDLNALSLVNQSYIEINNLDIKNQKSALGDYRGISVLGRDAGTLNHIYVRNCTVHDVTGEVNWIGGDSADNATGVTFQTGWDASKRTGGIVFEVQSSATTPIKTKFNDIVIENNVVRDCSFGGIIFKQLDGSVHWGVRSSTADANFTPHTNVTLRNNYINQHNTSYGCNGVYLTGVQTGLIEGNVVAEAGTSAIELYNTDQITVQHNETYGTVRKASGADYNGIDSDKATTKSVIQYNYIHDNGDGILLCQFSFGDSIVRYNIIQNNSRYQIYLHSDSKASSVIYNNTFYNDKYASNIAYGYGDYIVAPYAFTNNIFVSTKTNAVLTTGGGITYQNNLYFGANVSAAGDSKPISTDPRLVSPGQGANGSEAGPAFTSLGGYKLSSGSPAINAGVTVQNNGGQDFFGTKLYTGNADLGAYEAP